ncbi:Galectin-8 [Manis pentadactyla]|nr:Galectin-8 [Manis pentadactyla]
MYTLTSGTYRSLDGCYKSKGESKRISSLPNTPGHYLEVQTFCSAGVCSTFLHNEDFSAWAIPTSTSALKSIVCVAYRKAFWRKKIKR